MGGAALSGLGGAQTLAGVALLAYTAEQAIPLGTEIYAPINKPIVQPLAKEILRDEYRRDGREEAYSDDYVPWLSDQQMSYAVGVVGLMTRQNVGANFLVGSFGAEALVVAESASLIGARQLAACLSTTSTAFFIAACDYVLIGEEIFGAAAYLSESPKLRASIKGQDIAKYIALLLIILGVLFSSLVSGDNPIINLITW
jgi:hypothetical protein